MTDPLEELKNAGVPRGEGETWGELVERREEERPSSLELPAKVYVVCGEAGVPSRVYADKDDAEALLKHWREGAVSIYGELHEVPLYPGGVTR